MKLIYLLSLIIIISFSCNKKPKKDYQLSDYSYKKHVDTVLDSLTTPSDTVILDFVFGMNKKTFKKKIKNLISTKKLEQKSSIQIKAGGQNFKVEGYPYNLYLGTKEYPSLLKGLFHNNELNKVELTVYNTDPNTEDLIIKMYQNKYGNYLRKKNEIGSVSYFWVQNNLEIQIDYFISQSLILINYNNLITQQEIETQKSLEKLQKQQENKKFSKKTQSDI